MNKELFIETINQIVELNKEQTEFNDMLRRIDTEFGGGYIHNKTISILENLLKTLTNDESDWISYWLWELNFGESYTDGCVTESDGTIIPLRTPEDLYNLIISEQ